MIPGVGVQGFSSSMIADWQVDGVINLTNCDDGLVATMVWRDWECPVVCQTCGVERLRPPEISWQSLRCGIRKSRDGMKSTLPAGMEPNQPYLGRRGRPEGSTRLLAC